MNASLLRLTRTDCKALRLNDAYGVHKVVYSLFPRVEGGDRDFLFVDKGGDFNERRILIISERDPQTPQHGSIQTKKISDSFLNHKRYGFEVRMNPTKREKDGGKIVAIRGRESLSSWFLGKCEQWGVSVDPESLAVKESPVQSFEKGGEDVTQNAAIFVGRLSVTDHGKFVESFKKGIGRGKAFGFGLLQIVPLADETKN